MADRIRSESERFVAPLVTILALLAILAWWLWGAETSLDREPPVSETEVSDPVPEPVGTVSEVKSNGVEDSGVETSLPLPEEPRPPTFDVVRVDAEGNSLVAGQAEPGATVIVLLDDDEVSRAQAGSDGSFATILELPPTQAQRQFSLIMEMEGRESIESDAVVVIASVPADDPNDLGTGDPANVSVTVRGDDPEVNERDSSGLQDSRTGEIALASGDDNGPIGSGGDASEIANPSPVQTPSSEGRPGTATLTLEKEALAQADGSSLADQAGTDADRSPGRPQAETGGRADDGADGSGIAGSSEQRPGPPVVMLADERGVRILQSGGDETRDGRTVVIDTITYDDAGEVLLGGRGTANGYVRIYLDSEPVVTARIDEDGQWRTPLPAIESGRFDLRVDQLDLEGRVTSRLETPFQREDRKVLEAIRSESGSEGSRIRVITVQRGNTLWGIAHDRYGEGILYVRVFEANRARIRDPDLIYPGQIFALPE